MEQNADTGAPIASMAENRQNSGNGLKIATAIACVVAVCGIGFGVYGMMQSFQKDNQISGLKVQVEDSNGKITTLETEKIETNDEKGTTVTIADSAIKNENTEDYIYVGEWGIKIRIPDSLVGKIGYIFSGNDYLDITDYAPSYTYGQQIDWNNNSLLRISRNKSGEVDFEKCLASCSKLITTLDGYDYSYMLSGGNIELLQNTALKEMTKEDAYSEF